MCILFKRIHITQVFIIIVVYLAKILIMMLMRKIIAKLSLSKYKLSQKLFRPCQAKNNLSHIFNRHAETHIFRLNLLSEMGHPKCDHTVETINRTDPVKSKHCFTFEVLITTAVDSKLLH